MRVFIFLIIIIVLFILLVRYSPKETKEGKEQRIKLLENKLIKMGYIPVYVKEHKKPIPFKELIKRLLNELIERIRNRPKH